MENLYIILKVAVSLSVIWVWIGRQDSVISDFEKFGLSVQTRARVGRTKMVLALMMLLGIWIPILAIPASIGMASMMAAAQYYHWRHGSSLNKKIPSMVLLAMCVLIMI